MLEATFKLSLEYFRQLQRLFDYSFAILSLNSILKLQKMLPTHSTKMTIIAKYSNLIIMSLLRLIHYHSLLRIVPPNIIECSVSLHVSNCSSRGISKLFTLVKLSKVSKEAVIYNEQNQINASSAKEKLPGVNVLTTQYVETHIDLTPMRNRDHVYFLLWYFSSFIYKIT